MSVVCSKTYLHEQTIFLLTVNIFISVICRTTYIQNGMDGIYGGGQMRDRLIGML